MIEESLKIHGKHQFEVKQKVLFDRNERVIRYQIDTYFFLPVALQINRDNYSTKSFWRSLKNYMRLRPPNCQLAQLADGDALHALRAQLAMLAEQPVIPVAQYENLLKRHVLTCARALRLHSKRIRHQQHDDGDAVATTMASLAAALAAYRELRPYSARIEAKIASQAFAYCDEYLSLITSYTLRKLLPHLGENARLPVVAVLEDEAQYRARHLPEYAALDQADDHDNERRLYRWSLLRKYVSSYLYFDIRRKKGNNILLHSLYGIAAAISMIFATAIAFSWQDRYGSLSMNLFIALVIGYIFKDRIKEIGREQLYRLFRKWIPDHRLMIYRGEDTIVGICKESFHFMEESHLAPAIRELRAHAHWIKLVNDPRAENVLHYKKAVELRNQPELFAATQHTIIDITRFSIADFLKQVDNLLEELPLADDDNGSMGERVYHICMIRQVTLDGRTANELARIVINAEGIKRLEILQPLQFRNSDS